MKIGGVGLVSACGRGIQSFEKALKTGWQTPSEIDQPGSASPKTFVYQVSSEILKDKELSRKLRRSDKFSRMAVIAAADALADSKLEKIDRNRLGVIVALAFGPHVTTFELLDTLLDYGDKNVSPIKFSNSVQNAAASYITEVLEIQGPCLTVTNFMFSFQYALLMAKLWMEEERCDYCLVGAVEQYGKVLGYLQNRKLKPAPDGKIKPFNFKESGQVPGEGAVFFLVVSDITSNIYCGLESIDFNKAPPEADLIIIDADGCLADESGYLGCLSENIPTAAYSPLFGSMPIGSAFNCAAGALMLKNGRIYPNPVSENPLGINLLGSRESSNIERICNIRYNCNNENSIIQLTSF